eukprot:1160997-Pelagomonas_calceolata.AAC.13
MLHGFDCWWAALQSQTQAYRSPAPHRRCLCLLSVLHCGPLAIRVSRSAQALVLPEAPDAAALAPPTPAAAAALMPVEPTAALPPTAAAAVVLPAAWAEQQVHMRSHMGYQTADGGSVRGGPSAL